MAGGRAVINVTWLSLVEDDGNRGLQNFFMEPMAAGKAGAENSAATKLMRKIHDIISSSLLTQVREQRGLYTFATDA